MIIKKYDVIDRAFLISPSYFPNLLPVCSRITNKINDLFSYPVLIAASGEPKPRHTFFLSRKECEDTNHKERKATKMILFASQLSKE